MAKDPTREELEAALDGLQDKFELDRFDVEEAIYWFAADYHSGQGSNLYSVLSSSPFRPGPLARGPVKASMGEFLYDNLVAKFGD